MSLFLEADGRSPSCPLSLFRGQYLLKVISFPDAQTFSLASIAHVGLWFVSTVV
jgi:hypothetical protein